MTQKMSSKGYHASTCSFLLNITLHGSRIIAFYLFYDEQCVKTIVKFLSLIDFSSAYIAKYQFTYENVVFNIEVIWQVHLVRR